MTKRLMPLLLVALLFAVSLTSTRADEPAPNSLCRVLGTETLAYLEFKDIFGALERGKELAIYKFLTDPDLTAALDAMRNNTPAPADVDAEQLKAIAAGLKDILMAMKDLFSGSGAIALLPGKENGKPWGILSVGVSQGNDGNLIGLLRALPEKLQGLLEANGQQVKFTVRDDKIAGRDVLVWHSVDGKDNTEHDLLLAVEGGRLFIAAQKDDFERLFGLLDAKPTPVLTDMPEFRDCLNKTQAKEMFLFVNFPALARNSGDPKAAMLAGYLRAAGAGISFDGEYVRDHVLAAVQNIEQVPGLSSLIGAVTSAAPASLFPKETQAALFLNVPSPAELWPFLKNAPMVGMLAAQFQAAGVDFEKQILPAFGGEIGLAISHVPAVSFIAALAVKDMQMVSGALSGLATAGMLKSFDFKGRTMYALPSPNPSQQTLMTLAKGYLLVGSALDVKLALSLTQEKSLAANEAFSREWGRIKQYSPTAFLFVDTKGLLDGVYDLARGMLAMTGAIAANALPPKEVLLRHMIPFGIGLVVRKDEISLMTEGMFPISVFGAAAAFFMSAAENREPVPAF